MEHLRPPPELDLSTDDGTNVPEKWRQWRQTMELYIELSMARKSEKDKCSAFLYLIGQKGRDVYNAMNLNEEERDKIDILFTKFEEYCKSKQRDCGKVPFQHLNARQSRDNRRIHYRITTHCKNCNFGQL